MSLGLAIFLSTLVVSTVLLYHWGYLRKFLRAFVALLGVVVLVGGVWFGYQFYESRPTAQTAYRDLTLGMSMEEVIYTKGQPSNVISAKAEEGWQSVISVDELDKQENRIGLKGYYEWSFDEEAGSRVDVRFSPKTQKLVQISCYADEDYPGRCGVLGVSTGALEEDIIDAFGKPGHERIEGVTKTLQYPDLNLVMHLAQRKVYMLAVKSSGNE